MEVERVFACGGIPKKNHLLMEIYANVLNKKITVIDSEYAPAIGAAILGAICGGAHPNFSSAIQAMKEPVLYQVEPDRAQVLIYKKLFNAYKELHDLLGYKKARIMRNVSALM